MNKNEYNYSIKQSFINQLDDVLSSYYSSFDNTLSDDDQYKYIAKFCDKKKCFVDFWSPGFKEE